MGRARCGPSAVAYALAYRTVSKQFSAAGLAGWVMAHSPDASFSWQPARDLGLTLAGTLRLFFGGRLDQVKLEPVTIIGAAALVACALGLAVGWRRGGPFRFRVPPKDLLLWVALYVHFCSCGCRRTRSTVCSRTWRRWCSPCAARWSAPGWVVSYRGRSAACCFYGT